jgi:hypothetical protein
MQREERANALADEWLAMMSAISWADAAASIRSRDPLPCGETTSIEEEGGLFDVSDSWSWVDQTEGSIRLVIEVFESDGAPVPTAKRTMILSRR